MIGMQVLNIHERRIPRPAAEVGRLIDTLASEGDRLWPRALWPAMRFDRALGVGAEGGHGPIGYAVGEYRPGNYVRFRFTAPGGFTGGHWFDVHAEGDAACVLRHTISMDARGSGLLLWTLAIRALHDALIEDAFATAEAALGLTPQVRPWTPWVRLLRRLIAGRRARPQMFGAMAR
ncbi:MAG: SRPBCC family protein [Ignavibacteria bacterium]